MPAEDALRWNKRYTQESERRARPRDWLINHISQISNMGVALDLAMGLGENAGFLSNKGWRVIGVDISSIAAMKAKTKYPNILPVIADLTSPLFTKHKFDLVMNFYYLERNLIPSFRYLVKPGGFLLMETLTKSMQVVRPDISSELLLDKGELKELFSEWEILDYREGWLPNSKNGTKAIASIFARLPTT